MSIDLRCGRWEDVLGDVECDALICDPPYSDRVEKGVRSGSTMKEQRNQIGMGYAPISEAWAYAFVESWHPRCRGWMVIYGDHISTRWFEAALSRVRYTFAPLPLVKVGAAPRMVADGPASQAEWIVVARPRKADFVGTWPGLRGWYSMETVRAGHGHVGVRGGKSIEHMRAIVRDYSRSGDVVCDPCAGGATTLIAALMEGRSAIGAERSYATAELASYRIERALAQQSLFVPSREAPVQEGLPL